MPEALRPVNPTLHGLLTAWIVQRLMRASKRLKKNGRL
jgi:hypothetical protein